MSDPVPWKEGVGEIVMSKSRRLALVVGYGRGRSPAMFIQEIRKDGSFAKREPYWVRSYGPDVTWQSKGKCKIRWRRSGDFQQVEIISRLVLDETEAPHNPSGIDFTYEVDVEVFERKGWFSVNRYIKTVRIKAPSGEVARQRVARQRTELGLPDHILVRGARPLAASGNGDSPR